MEWARERHGQAFRHVLVEVLGQDESSPLYNALVLEGFDSIADLLCIPEDQVYSLSYSTNAGNIPVSQAAIDLLLLFLSFASHLLLTRIL